VGCARRVAVSEVEDTVAEHAWAVGPVPVPVTNQRDITRIAILVPVVGDTETLLVGTQTVDDVEALLGRSVQRHRVHPVPVEIPRQGYVSGVAEEKVNVGDTPVVCELRT
jgi:hypothetical protein